jgi:tape measure domain-containing protein
MARYTIDFTTNASRIVREIEAVNRKVAQVARTGKSVQIKLDAAPLQAGLNATFRQLDKQIENMQRKLSRLQIGSGAFRSTAASLGFREGQRERGQLAAEPLRLRGQAQSFDEASLVRLNKELQAARIEASQLAPNTAPWIDLQRQIGQINSQLKATDRLAESIQMQESLGAFAPGSLNALEAKLIVLRNRAREISPSGETLREWKKLNKEILDTEGAIEKQTRRPLTGGQRLGAAGGAFLYGGGLGGGVGSAVGGIAGGLMGGVPGAFAGAAFGQLADNLGTMAAGATNTAATIQQLQRGLALASIDAADFAEAQKAIAESSNTLVVPIERVYRQFTQLRVNTKQYGLSVQETQQILEGVVLAVSSVGGSMEDVDGAMRAVVQIFSKGSVQAEELRGQLGERFPGAVVKFAQANKMSFDELQGALEQGKVTVGDFVDFAKKNYEDYAKFSERLATGPEFAGRRLEKAMNDMQIAIGSALGPAGAVFQDFFAETISGFSNWANQNKEFIAQYLRDWAVLATDFARIVGSILKVAVQVSTAITRAFSGAIREIRRLLGMVGVAEIKAELDKVNAQIAAGQTGGRRRGAAQSPLETRRQQLQAQFAAAGGQAALDAASAPGGKDFTFGGPGAGMSLDGGSGAGKGRKTKELKDFENNVTRELQRRLELSKKYIDLNAELTTSQKELRKAELDYSYGIAIAQAQYDEGKKKVNEYKESQRGLAQQYLDNLAIIDRDNVTADYRKALLGDLISLADNYEKSIADLDDSIAALTSGQENLSEAQKLENSIARKTVGYNEEQLEIIKPFLDLVRRLAKVKDERLKTEKDLNATLEAQNKLEKEILAPLRDQIALLRTVNTEEAKRLEIRQKYPSLKDEDINRIYQLEKVRENIEATRQIIDGFVTDTSSDYKGFLKQVISGEDAADALKKFQEGLKDRVLTIFLDFTMAPVEKFFKEALGGNIINALFPKTKEEEQPAEKANTPLGENTAALGKATTAIDSLTSAIQGAGAAPSTSVPQAAANGLPGMSAIVQGVDVPIDQMPAGMQFADLEQSAAQYKESLSSVNQAISEKAEEAGPNGTAGAKWQEALGQTVQGIGIAAGSIMGIMAGIKQIEEGGTSNVLGGIGSILLSVGGAIGGFAGMFKQAGKAANGAVWKGGFQAFANGGMVTGPTLGLIGEGKYNEAIVPLPDGKSIPVQMRGQQSSRDLLSNGATSQQSSPVLSMSFQTTKFGDREYVDVAQLQAAMAETRKMAARDGANRGASLALDKLQNSPSARRKVGMR